MINLGGMPAGCVSCVLLSVLPSTVSDLITITMSTHLVVIPLLCSLVSSSSIRREQPRQ